MPVSAPDSRWRCRTTSPIVTAPGGLHALYRPEMRSLDAQAHEIGEIAHVDELDRIAGRSRREHLAAARRAHRPIGEAIGRVARSDDVRRTNDRLALAERLLDDLLASRFQAP